MSLSAYRRVKSLAEHPRGTESRLIGEITGEMLSGWEAGLRGAQLMPALHRNREMWTMFSTACMSEGNQLPDTTRAAIVSLALWVDRFTSEVVRGQETIEPLVSVNRSLIGGLAGGAQSMAA